MKASCSSHWPGSEESPSPWSGCPKNARSSRRDEHLLAAPGCPLVLSSRHPSLDPAGARHVLADRVLFGPHPDHAGVQLYAPGNLRRGGSWLYSRALRSLLRSSLPGCPSANLPLVGGLHGHLPPAGIPGGLSHRTGGSLAAPAAAVGGAAFLDQLPGPDLRHDLSAAR